MDSTFEKTKIGIAADLIDSAKQIVITSHRSPDGDAVGSSLALWHYLKLKGKRVNVVLPDSYPAFLHWMPGHEELITHEKDPELARTLISEADLIFSLDYNDLSRTGDLQPLLEQSNAAFILIDHHQQPGDYPRVSFSNTAACSTAEMIYQLIEGLNDLHLINVPLGQCIYTGIMTDSGSFRFPNVSPLTHRIAAHLLESGVDHSYIHQLVYDNNLMNRLKLVGYALSQKLVHLHGTRAAYIVLSQDELHSFNFQPGDTEGLVNYALSLQGVNVAAFMREGNNRIKLSLRSKGSFDVNQLARTYFNGGGHKNAAGGALDCTLEEATNLLTDTLKKHADEMDY